VNTVTGAKKPDRYYVVLLTTTYKSLAEAKADAPELIATHIARSKELHARGTLVMAGAFLDHPEEPLSTMAVLTSREACEDFLKGDPFVRNRRVAGWTIRVWANIFA
jgi:uncharacterized protein YciI